MRLRRGLRRFGRLAETPIRIERTLYKGFAELATKYKLSEDGLKVYLTTPGDLHITTSGVIFESGLDGSELRINFDDVVGVLTPRFVIAKVGGTLKAYGKDALGELGEAAVSAALSWLKVEKTLDPIYKLRSLIVHITGTGALIIKVRDVDAPLVFLARHVDKAYQSLLEATQRQK